jgi:predicted transcriptional regulator
MGNVLAPTIRKDRNNNESPVTIKPFSAECINCNPITPFQCINKCKVYKQKNELRHLRATMDDPNYINELFNVLKNMTRLDILETIVEGRYTAEELQQKLKKTGHCHSQGTIVIEYLRPLMAVGLAAEARDQYYATTFGRRVAEKLGSFPALAKKLPAHSECHEEALMVSMLSGSKTFEGVEGVISSKIVSRILNRLRTTGLVQTPLKRDYVFFHKSKRDSTKDTFTATERKIYDAITFEGISAGCLTDKTGVSIRRIYKYVRGLKGKKLVFCRTTPKTYALTADGEEMAKVMQEVQQVVEETWQSTEQVMADNEVILELGGSSGNAVLR